MSAGPAGLRHVMVTLDEKGKPLSAGDWVMFRSQTAEGVTYVHENVGGRLEPDGRFLGTRWRSVTFERAGATGRLAARVVNKRGQSNFSVTKTPACSSRFVTGKLL